MTQYIYFSCIRSLLLYLQKLQSSVTTGSSRPFHGIFVDSFLISWMLNTFPLFSVFESGDLILFGIKE